MRSLLPELPIFVAVARAGGFTEAARTLEISPAGVSKAIQRLEESIGAPLFARTTRRVTLTAEGERFLPHAEEALRQVRVGQDAVSLAQQVAEGELRASLSFVLGRFVCSRLCELVGRYPGLKVRLFFTDRLSRLVDERVDVALRLGEPRDPAVVARRLGSTRWSTVASPAYLARHGRPESIEALAHHRNLKFRTPRGTTIEWTFDLGDGPQRFETPTQIDVDQGEALLDCALAGVGIAQVFSFMAEPLVAEGRLVEVLEDVSAEGPPLTMLYLPGRQRLPRVQAFVTFVEALAKANVGSTPVSPRTRVS